MCGIEKRLLSAPITTLGRFYYFFQEGDLNFTQMPACISRLRAYWIEQGQSQTVAEVPNALVPGCAS